MAKKKSGPNMSDAIREYLAGNPEASANDVITALKGHGLKVKSSLVYFIKGKLKAKKQRKTRVTKAAQAATGNGRGHEDALTLIREIKALAAKSGGIGKLKALVEALAE